MSNDKAAEYEKNLKEKEELMRACKREIKTVQNEQEKEQDLLHVYQEKLKELNVDIQYKTSEIERHNKELGQIEKNYQEIEKKVDNLIGNTQRERIRSLLSEDKLTKLINTNTRRINQINSEKENITEVESLLRSKQHSLSKQVKNQRVFEEIISNVFVLFVESI